MKLNKWNTIFKLNLNQVLDYCAQNGINLDKESTVITGTDFNPETQEIIFYLTTIVSNKKEKELEKINVGVIK